MPRECALKFSSSGLPHVLEFDNVSFAPERPPPPPSPSSSSSSSSSSFCYVDVPPPPPRTPPFSFLSPSSLFKRKPASTPPHEPSVRGTKPLPPPPSEPHGICIRFPPEYAASHPQVTRRERLVRLQQTISVAVLNAGMDRSPGNNARPEKPLIENVAHGTPRYRTPDAMFCGTYGQMMAALEAAGLSATSCAGEDLTGYTRLGALFVARNNGASGVQLRKITLWG